MTLQMCLLRVCFVNPARICVFDDGLMLPYSCCTECYGRNEGFHCSLNHLSYVGHMCMCKFVAMHTLLQDTHITHTVRHAVTHVQSKDRFQRTRDGGNINKPDRCVNNILSR